MLTLTRAQGAFLDNLLTAKSALAYVGFGTGSTALSLSLGRSLASRGGGAHVCVVPRAFSFFREQMFPDLDMVDDGRIRFGLNIVPLQAISRIPALVTPASLVVTPDALLSLGDHQLPVMRALLERSERTFLLCAGSGAVAQAQLQQLYAVQKPPRIMVFAGTGRVIQFTSAPQVLGALDHWALDIAPLWLELRAQAEPLTDELAGVAG